MIAIISRAENDDVRVTLTAHEHHPLHKDLP